MISKNDKIIIIGFGSIGKRHCQNLFSLGYRNVTVFDPVKKTFNNFNSINRLNKINVETARDFKIAFICSPNNLHIKHALICAQAGCHLFIEKPLSHNLKKIKELKKICEEKKIINMVACNLRFHPCAKFAKKYIDGNKLGKVYGISHEFGYFLPYWRPGHDYRKNYAKKKSTGGGIILDDIHEFDLLSWLNSFEKILEAKFIFDKVSNLEIETEDMCLASFKFANKVIGSVRCDYLQQNESRNFKVIGEKGNLEVDLIAEAVYLKNKSKNQKLLQINRKNDNDDFINEVKYFFAAISKKQKTFNDVKDACEVLKYCVNKKI
jgi:predicted dehydrogenase